MNLHRMKKIILILLLAIPVLIEAQNVMTETRQVLISPDGAYRFTFYQRALGKDNTRMYYTLTYKDRPVVEESELGIQIKNQLFESALAVPNDTCHFWCENLKMTGAERREIDESWKPVYGERSVIRDHYNEMTLKFSKGEGEGKKEDGYDKRKNYLMNIIFALTTKESLSVIIFRKQPMDFSSISQMNRPVSQCPRVQKLIMNVGHRDLMSFVRWKDGEKKRANVR